MKMHEVNFVHVPHYDELKPSNVIEQLSLKKSEKMWNKLLSYCPELKYKSSPKDRDFFYNILNTLWPKIVEKLVYNATL